MMRLSLSFLAVPRDLPFRYSVAEGRLLYTRTSVTGTVRCVKRRAEMYTIGSGFQLAL